MAALTIPTTGKGTTVSGLGLTTLIRKISGLEENLGGFETTDIATADFKTMKKLDLADNPKVTVEAYHTGAAITLGATGTYTITYPSAGSYSGTGWISKVKYPDAEQGTALITTFEITFDGYTGPAFTAA